MSELGRQAKEQLLPLRWLMGPSRQMQKVVQQIKQVADSPLTILVEGETGTGKEIVARAIHQLSARRKKPFVAVDCGAIPDTLIESELFGYEKGAFTGHISERPGCFRLPRGEACSSTRSSTSRFRRRGSCCVRCRNGRCSR